MEDYDEKSQTTYDMHGYTIALIGCECFTDLTARISVSGEG